MTDQAALYRQLHRCMQIIAGVCDGAAERDGQGFSRFDASFGKVLANTEPGRWSPEMASVAHGFAVKYRRQLVGAGIDAEKLPKPVTTASANGLGRKSSPRSDSSQLTIPTGGFKGTIEGSMLACASSRWPGRDAIDAVKAIPGRSWDKRNKVWRVPLAAASKLLEVIEAGHIRPADGVLEALQARVAAMVDAAKLSTAVSGDVEIAGLGGTLRPFQAAGAEYALKGIAGDVIDIRTFIADEMGLGKTVQALAIAKAVKDRVGPEAGPIVAVVPKSVKLNWAREAQFWIPVLRRIVVIGSSTVTELPADTDLVVMTYGCLAPKGHYIDRLKGKPLRKAFGRIVGSEPDRMATDGELHKQIREHRAELGITTWVDALAKRNPLTLIVDESHFVKGHKSQRTVAVDKLAHAPSIRCKLLLTGTPVENEPSELIAQLKIIDRLDDLGGWYRFTQRYCIQGKWGGFEQGGKNLDELNAKMRAGGFYVRRMKADVATELPPKVRTDVPIEINRRRYDAALRKASARIKAAKIERATARREGREPEGWAVAAAAVAINELRQLAAELKLPGAVEWCKDQISTGQKLIVFAHHRPIVEKLAAELEAPVIMGGTSDNDRQAAVDRFQNDPSCQAIVLNIVAGGFGITLTASSNVVFVERHLVPAKEDQAIDRAHRIGQEADSVNAWFLAAANTVDDWIANLVARKRETVDAVNEGDDEARKSVIAELEALIEASVS